jgi:hypothetical protein
LVDKAQRFNNSNLWYINAAKLHAEAKKNRDEAKAEKADESVSPFDPPIVSARPNLTPTAAEQAVIDGLDSKATEKDSKLPKQKIGKKQVEEVITLLKTHFGEHETFKEKDADYMMADCARHCIRIAGSSDLCISIFEWVFREEPVRATVAKKDLLGGYIKSRFDDWFAEFEKCKDEDEPALSDDIEAMGNDEENEREIARIVAEHMKQTGYAVADNDDEDEDVDLSLDEDEEQMDREVA